MSSEKHYQTSLRVIGCNTCNKKDNILGWQITSNNSDFSKCIRIPIEKEVVSSIFLVHCSDALCITFQNEDFHLIVKFIKISDTLYNCIPLFHE